MNKAFGSREFTPYNGNQLGLVYTGALTENNTGAVNIQAIQYPYRDFSAVADVYTPAGLHASQVYPAVVIAHSNGGVKK